MKNIEKFYKKITPQKTKKKGGDKHNLSKNEI